MPSPIKSENQRKRTGDVSEGGDERTNRPPSGPSETHTRRSRTSNKDREKRIKIFDSLIGEFKEKQLEMFAISNYDPEKNPSFNSRKLHKQDSMSEEEKEVIIKASNERRKVIHKNPQFIKNIYHTIEKEFEIKKKFCKFYFLINQYLINYFLICKADRDWMAKN